MNYSVADFPLNRGSKSQTSDCHELMLPCIGNTRLRAAGFRFRHSPQTPSPANTSPRDYTLNASVDEVILTFHPTDAQGLPIHDLKADEVTIRDDALPPRRVVSFVSLQDRPIRAALLLDTSQSMQFALRTSKELASTFLKNTLREASDQAMIMEFGNSSDFLQSWTGDRLFLDRSIQNVRSGRMNPLPGTAIFDTVFRACFYGFKDVNPGATGNFILLLSDGEDNAGHTSLDEALRACQRSNVAIYAFLIPDRAHHASTGSQTLRSLATQTGGQVFAADQTPETILSDLKIIESETRNQYRIVYNPAAFRHDGKFRTIQLHLPDRVAGVVVRSGYLAPLP